MTRDMSWRPTRRLPRKKNPKLFVIVVALIAVNAAVIYYHGDWRVNAVKVVPSTRDTPALGLPGQPVQSPKAANPDSVQRGALMSPKDDVLFAAHVGQIDPTLGLRSMGVVQRIETVVLKNRQTPASALLTLGVHSDEVSGALTSLTDLIDFRRMRPGDSMKARLDADGGLLSLDVTRGMLEQARTKRGADGWEPERIDVAVDTVVAEVNGAVRTSLWDALHQAGEDARLVQDLVEIFAYEIDFYSEVHPGDRFSLLVEKRYANGQFLDYGDVTAAQFVSGDDDHLAFLERSPVTGANYYDEDGNSLRKQLLKAPLKYGPVTSGFGVRRHPILGYTRNHNGTDYGVPIGTPVWSVGDGRVSTAGWHGGFGRLVEVTHPNGWVSQYAHLSRINVHVGQHVQQKDIVGLVGQTGLATGPHLHYGLKKNGAYVNSLAQKFERSPSLTGSDLLAFNKRVTRLRQDLNRMQIAQEPSVHAPQKG